PCKLHAKKPVPKRAEIVVFNNCETTSVPGWVLTAELTICEVAIAPTSAAFLRRDPSSRDVCFVCAEGTRKTRVMETAEKPTLAEQMEKLQCDIDDVQQKLDSVRALPSDDPGGRRRHELHEQVILLRLRWECRVTFQKAREVMARRRAAEAEAKAQALAAEVTPLLAPTQDTTQAPMPRARMAASRADFGHTLRSPQVHSAAPTVLLTTSNRFATLSEADEQEQQLPSQPAK
ncbi:hypothetical protein QJQ45_014773, partial [Haematococcus lacustris]